ncbi:hypothetical protein KY290_017520 [Solanum tuberosum]|uniref:Putative plant transposon protein domain-containing protein n=1 Tax=Solanum tuberosum TaxID=4113 RepID=A0ABQ7VBH5_SOLTU|nr:hypothetical protein KY290_017520 [Solanum tuberosum]
MSILPGHSTTIVVRNVVVLIDPKAFNELLDLPNVDQAAYVKKLKVSKSKIREWVAYVLGKEEEVPNWKLNNSTIKKRTFSQLAKNWVSFILGRLQPCKNDDEIPLHRGLVTASIIKKWPINVGQVMTTEIISACKKTKTTQSLHFPWDLTES